LDTLLRSAFGCTLFLLKEACSNPVFFWVLFFRRVQETYKYLRGRERPSALRMMSHMALDRQEEEEKDFGGCVNWCLVSTSLCVCLSLGSQQLYLSPAKSSCVCDHLRYSFWSIFARMTWPTVALIRWVRLLQNIAGSKLLES
jgi:hypothetical protein